MKTFLKVLAGLILLLLLAAVTALAVVAVNARAMEFVIRQVLQRAAPAVQAFHFEALDYSYPGSWVLHDVHATVVSNGSAVQIAAPRVRVEDALNLLTDDASAAIRVSGAEVTCDAVRLGDLTCEADMRRSPSGLLYRGTVSIGTVSQPPLQVADVKLTFSGNEHSVVMSNLTAVVFGGSLSGAAHAELGDPAGYGVELRLTGGGANPLLQLGRLIPEVESLSVEGQAGVTVTGTPSSAEAKLSLVVSRLELPANHLIVSNLNSTCTLRFSDQLRSLPGQTMTADSVSIGNLRLTQLRLNYQIEPDSTFFVEDVDFKWCDGWVSLYRARFGPNSTTGSARLLCDRLSLGQVLKACGLKGFSAGGELNGRIPVQWSKEGVSIERGFLFTTPGKGGTFAFGDAALAASLLPPGSLEAGQVGLISSALAEFNYNWITMTLNSEGENLLIVIEVSGEPAQVLPYEYDSRSGAYVKVPKQPGRGIRQPMNFTLNLTVPLNRLLCYASGINKQWNLFKAQP